PERQPLALEGQARGEDGVLQLVVALGQLCGDETALTRLAQAVQPFALVALGSFLFLAERVELIAAEEVGIPSNDCRLLGDFLFADAHRPPFFGTLVQIALKLLFEFRGAADSGRRHRENSIRLVDPRAKQLTAPSR